MNCIRRRKRNISFNSIQHRRLLLIHTNASSTVADHCRARHLSDDVLLATALVVIALATATLGLALMGIGRLGLASIVQVRA